VSKGRGEAGISVGLSVADAVGIGVMDGIAVAGMVMVGLSTVPWFKDAISLAMIAGARIVDVTGSLAKLSSWGFGEAFSTSEEHALIKLVLPNNNTAANSQFHKVCLLAFFVVE